MTEELVAAVKGWEKLMLKPYLCPAKYPTIGYGHRIPSMVHPPITEAEADQLLAVDLGIAERQALQLCENLSTEPRRLASLTDLCFNVGMSALDGQTPNLLDDDAGVVMALRAGNWPDAARRFRLWDKAHVHGVLTELPGLKARRETGAEWIEQGG